MQCRAHRMSINGLIYKESDPETTIPVEEIETKGVPKYLAWAYKLDSFGVETRGIERVSPQERRELCKSKRSQFMYVLGLWFAACGGLTSMSSFFLPTLLFGLNLKNSLVSGLISMIIGCLVPAYCSTMGPKSGCRQMVGARFLFGQWGVKFVALVCIVGGIGWSVVNCVLGGQLLSALGSSVPLSAGIIIVAVVSLVVAVFGIKVLLKFQTITAIPVTVAALLFYIVVFKKIDYVHVANQLILEQNYSDRTVQGNWLSFFTMGYSVTASWGGGASDYYILFPEETSSWQVFLITFLGIAVPTTFVAIVGTICGTIAYAYDPWHAAYNENGIGGLIAESFTPWGHFGKFVVVILFISLVCNNIMNTYSVAFEFQVIDERLAMLPRWCWAILVTIIYFVLSIAGREHFSTILGNFLPMLSYWITIYITLLLQENYLFRRRKNVRILHPNEFNGVDDHDASDIVDAPVGSWLYTYNWNNWNQPHLITMGIAAAVAFACGAVGAAMGMNQVYYKGPLAKKIGDYGGEIGMWLAGGFAAIVYPIVRYYELKKFGR